MTSVMAAKQSTLLDTIVHAALSGALTPELAMQLHALGPEAVSFAMIATTTRILELEGRPAAGDAASANPATPSGMIPVYQKPNKSAGRTGRRRPGGVEGHRGSRRAKPTRIDRRETHRRKRCPDCGGPLQRCCRTRTRIIEDIPEVIEPVVTEHTIHRDYCKQCKKDVEPVVPDAMPKATIGHHLVVMTSWLHYGLGLTIEQIIDVLQHYLQTTITPGGLVDAWHRLAVMLEEWYEQIGEQARQSAHLHADETGWRVDGDTHWLWCFTNDRNCYYMIDRSRGSPALQQFFTSEFEGVLITDFWSPYESVCAEDRQYCLVHLLREVEKVDESNGSQEWYAFSRKLRRLLRDGIRLRKRDDFAPGKFPSLVERLTKRLVALAGEEYTDGDTRRLAKRLRKHAEYVFTFLDYDHVPFENNFAERQIRPAVILRKNGQANRSERGAATQSVLMSVYRTMKLRGLAPKKTIVEAVRQCVATGRLPHLPDQNAARG
jgi:transposase